MSDSKRNQSDDLEPFDSDYTDESSEDSLTSPSNDEDYSDSESPTNSEESKQENKKKDAPDTANPTDFLNEPFDIGEDSEPLSYDEPTEIDEPLIDSRKLHSFWGQRSPETFEKDDYIRNKSTDLDSSRINSGSSFDSDSESDSDSDSELDSDKKDKNSPSIPSTR